MFKNNAFKKFSVVLASLALIVPLASVGNYSVSANAKSSKKQVVRMTKKARHNTKRKATKHARKAVVPKMDDNGNVKGHHYYKYAYNYKEYRKSVKYIRTQVLGVKKLDEKFNVNHKSQAYRFGFNDSLNNTQHRKYVNNKQYEKGYLIADAYTIRGKVNKKTINDGKRWFKEFKANGPATAPAIDQIKWEAHIDTL